MSKVRISANVETKEEFEKRHACISKTPNDNGNAPQKAAHRIQI